MRAMKPAILERLRGVQRAGDGWLAFCPAHNDQHKRSLSVGLGTDGRTLLKCHAAGCPVEQITAAVSMTLADLAPPARQWPPPITDDRRDLRLHRRERQASVPGGAPRAEGLSAAAP